MPAPALWGAQHPLSLLTPKASPSLWPPIGYSPLRALVGSGDGATSPVKRVAVLGVEPSAGHLMRAPAGPTDRHFSRTARQVALLMKRQNQLALHLFLAGGLYFPE